MPRRLFHTSTKKVGAPPGQLVHVGKRRIEEVELSLIRYAADSFREERHPLPGILAALAERHPKHVTWVNINGLHDPEVIGAIGTGCNLHLLVQEDILNTHQRPKAEAYDDHLYLVVRMLRFDESNREILGEQVSLVVGSDYVISFQESPGDVFDGVRDRLRQGKGRIRQRGADYLAYALLDAVVDSYYVLLEKLGDRIELLEEQMVSNPDPDALSLVHQFKREMILLRKSVWPLRELLGNLTRDSVPLLAEETRVFLRDVHDHAMQVIDTVETYRDILTGLQDLYLSGVSNRMNEIMKVLTMIATIFIPLSFLAGLYGMNFEVMPELHWRHGYFILLGLMALLAVGMLIFFRRKKWL